ncbi:FimV/HubP family polar landmark protein [Caballeronia sp. dw_19]|uniref:FimV/HubP family polar landmark protein n=1 Tax=Caballeronia sp. dw_19 TaxID=2719791 RepID=UPI001BD33263|nr:FimV/HubP family polar landmark protein [Caballeronia sp. dw_19]
MIVRPSRPLHSPLRFLSRSRRAALIAASVASVLLGTFVSSDATAQASSASAVSEASAPVSASAPVAPVALVTQYSVKPGQSLSDIASQITGSNDRATREKMSRALFDANPNAFMGHDPSRLKLGSVLNVPAVEDAGVAAAASEASEASAPVAASSPVAEASGSVGAAAPVEGTSNAAGAVSGAAMAASGAVTAVAPNAASEPNAALPTSEAQPAASASEAANASASEVAPASEAAPALSASSTPAATVAPVSAPSATGSTAISANGPIGWLVGAVAVIGLLLLVMRSGKRRRAASAAAALTAAERAPQAPPVVSKAPEITAVPPHDGSTSHAQASTGAADLDGASVQRAQGELNVVAASMENYDAAQSFDTPTEDKPFPPAESNAIDDDADGAQVTLGESRAQDAAPARDTETKRAPFMPDAPAALHRDFTPPRPGAIEAALAAERAAADRAEALRAEMEAREHELREAAALEQATREAVAQEAAARELEAQEATARELAAQEAAAREAAAHEAAMRETEAHEVAAREAAARETEAREAAAREAAALEAQARETQARETAAQEAATRASAAHESGEHVASAQSAIAPQSATNQRDDAEDASAYDDEPSPASRFPQPKFPQEAIEALSALDFGLPPRQEAPAPSDVQPPAPAAFAESTAQNEAPLAPAPATPQPIADPAVFDRQNAQHSHPESATTPPSASEQIESGTAGAASVAGLGASRFGPLSLDFDYNTPASQSEPLPAFTPEQISTIARNKLELAVEYIELGDLSGARTLLQEVIESNDPATRQPAVTLLSTLAPLS